MKRTTVVSGNASAATSVSDKGERPERGSLKLFFSYAPFTGTTTALLDEVQGMVGRGRDVFLAELSVPSTGKKTGMPFDIDQVLKRKPDLVALDDFAAINPPGSRNHHRYQDALELLHAGIDVYAVLRVSNLENERDRITLITGREPQLLVPDRLFYTASQVEFVDIDPQALCERSAMAGRTQDSLAVLKQLRALALQCVSFYASSSHTLKNDSRLGEAAVSRDHVVAVVSPDESPMPLLREAMRLSSVGHSPLQAVCLRRETRARSQGESGQDIDPDVKRLADKAEALDFEFVELWGDDELETLQNYLRMQSVSDVVISRSLLNRLAPLSFKHRHQAIDSAFSNERVHVVPTEYTAGQGRRVMRRGAQALLDFKATQLLFALFAVVVASCVAGLVGALGLGAINIYLVYMLASTIVAITTKSYLPSILAIILSCIAQASVIHPTFRFAVGYTGYITYAFMVIVLAIVTFAAVSMGRTVKRTQQRERDTQALYELNRSLAYAHGQLEVVDVSLDALVRLFGRSVAFYLADPFDRHVRDKERRPLTVREAPDDMGAEQFDRINELNIAHWVFVNGSEAGAGTDTNSTSDIRYIPLIMDDNVIGVIAISEHRPLDDGDRSFLKMVISRILAALERQALSASHLRDMQTLHVGAIRDVFMGHLVNATSLSAATIAEISRMLQSSREDDTLYHDALEQAIGLEAQRSRIVSDRLHADIVETPTEPSCDIRAIVGSAVEHSRQGRGSTVIELEPGENVPDLVADGPMIERAVLFVLEASLLFAPVGGTVTVSIQVRSEYLTISVSDDRPDSLAGPSAAFVRDYDAERAKSMLAFLSDHDLATDDERAMNALAKALHVPLGACTVDGKADLRRISRVDRVQYGLYMAALIVRAHNGTARMRHRLGGGAVTTLSLPLE